MGARLAGAPRRAGGRASPGGGGGGSSAADPAASRAAPVEAEYELIQVALQMRFLDRALVGAQQPPFGQRGDPVHRGQQLARVIAAGAGRPLAAPLVDIAEPG